MRRARREEAGGSGTPPERGVLDVIRLIKQGDLDPAQIDPETRRGCVQHLWSEGATVPETALFLGCSDRTITRDRRAIEDANALSADPALPGRIAGQLMVEAQLAIGRLKRLARDRDAPHAARVEAERAVVPTICEAIRTLQGLGFLPSAARRVEAELTHRAGPDDLPSLGELEAELERMTAAHLETGARELPPGLAQLRGLVDRAKIAAGLTAAALPRGATAPGGPPRA